VTVSTPYSFYEPVQFSVEVATNGISDTVAIRLQGVVGDADGLAQSVGLAVATALANLHASAASPATGPQ